MASKASFGTLNRVGKKAKKHGSKAPKIKTLGLGKQMKQIGKKTL